MVLSTILFHLLSLVIAMSGEDSSTMKENRYISGNNTNTEEAIQFLNRYNELAITEMHDNSLALWNYDNNLTDYNRDKMLEQDIKSANFTKEMWKQATSFAWKKFQYKNDKAYRSFKALSLLGDAVLPPDKYSRLGKVVAEMGDIYGKATVCPFNNTENLPCDLDLEPELTELLKTPGNYDELAYYWTQWRNNSGRKMRNMFLEMVDIKNEAARLNGFSDEGESRRHAYESETFVDDIENLWDTLKPFYEQLHAYVRRKLIKMYPGHIKPDGPIPAHLFGNMWAQTWENIFNLVNPHPEKRPIDVTDAMVQKNMTALQMFKMSEEFFVSLGLIPMPFQFWNNSVIEKPTDREIICHASAWDLFYKDNVRIKMCTRIDQQDLITIHHEMGHVQYYLQYANQPTLFRDGANPGFHEAVGDTLAFSVKTPSHLKEIGLLEHVEEDEDVDINFLMKMATEKIAFLPFGYLIDRYRWQIFDGSIKPDELNAKWWEMRLKYQGICPPVARSEADFDPGSKYHVAADVPYIRYFVSYVIQFQFHKSLCDASGYSGPLHKCDIYRSKEAGALLSKMLSLGASGPWEEAMSIITQGRTNKMDAEPMLDYFRPLMSWLERENENSIVGWRSNDPSICP